MAALNGCAPKRVTVTGSHTFTVEASPAELAAPYTTGGIMTQVKQPATVAFQR